jgi:hypothetical protein
MDIYIGHQSSAVEDRKSMYESLGSVFSFEAIHLSNFMAVLTAFIPQAKVDYLYKQFSLFFTEYHYWKSCLRLKKILFKDVENVPLMPLEPADQFEFDRNDFMANLILRAVTLLQPYSI